MVVAMTTLLSEFCSLFVVEYLSKLHFGMGSSLVAGLDMQLQRLFEEAKTVDVLMSRNDELDDLPTSSLLFAMLPFAIGDIEYSHSKFDRETRPALLAKVEGIWSEFLHMMTQLGLTPNFAKFADPRSARIEFAQRQDVLKPQVKELIFHLSKNSIDLDDVRDLVIDTLEYFAIQCSNDIRFLREEREMLEMAAPSVEVAPVKKPWSMKLDKSQVRAFAKSQVFQPDIAMPTMTLDEFARLEMEALSQSKSIKNTAEELNYRKQEELEVCQLLKDRAWDDWKDDNTKGAGNKMTNLG